VNGFGALSIAARFDEWHARHSPSMSGMYVVGCGRRRDVHTPVSETDGVGHTLGLSQWHIGQSSDGGLFATSMRLGVYDWTVPICAVYTRTYIFVYRVRGTAFW